MTVASKGLQRRLRPGLDAPRKALTGSARVVSVNATDRPPTLTVLSGDGERPMAFLGSPADWHPGDLAEYLDAGTPLALGRLPLRGVGSPLEDPDEAQPDEDYRAVGGTDQPAFGASWANFGGTHATAAFYRQGDYWVRLRGLVAGGAMGSTIFTLPAGYAPPVTMYFTTLSNGGASFLRVEADGDVVWVSGGNSVWLSLNGITFPSRWNPLAWHLPHEVSGWRYDSTYPHSDPMCFVRDDGWAWWKGVVANGTTNGSILASPERARSAWADVLFGQGLGLVRMDHGGGGTTAGHGQAIWREVGGSTTVALGGVAYFSHIASDAQFTALTLANGWANFGADYRQCQAYKDPYGVVHLHGLASGAAKTTNIVATLPQYWRPAAQQVFLSMFGGDVVGRVDVHPDGRIEAVSAGTGYTSLSSISFRAEQ